MAMDNVFKREKVWNFSFSLFFRCYYSYSPTARVPYFFSWDLLRSRVDHSIQIWTRGKGFVGSSFPQPLVLRTGNRREKVCMYFYLLNIYLCSVFNFPSISSNMEKQFSNNRQNVSFLLLPFMSISIIISYNWMRKLAVLVINWGAT